MEEEILSQVKGERAKTRPKVVPKIIKHSRIEYRDGRFLVKGDKLAFDKKIPEDLAKM